MAAPHWDSDCRVHQYHRPRPIRIVEHHIQPRAMGGPDTVENKVPTCDTGHFNIHRILATLIDAKPSPGGTRVEKQLADLGYSRWVAAGKPGRPVYEATA